MTTSTTISTSGEAKRLIDRLEADLDKAKRRRVIDNWRALRQAMPEEAPQYMTYETILRVIDLLKLKVEIRP